MAGMPCNYCSPAETPIQLKVIFSGVEFCGECATGGAYYSSKFFLHFDINNSSGWILSQNLSNPCEWYCSVIGGVSAKGWYSTDCTGLLLHEYTFDVIISAFIVSGNIRHLHMEILHDPIIHLFHADSWDQESGCMNRPTIPIINEIIICHLLAYLGEWYLDIAKNGSAIISEI